MSVQMQEFSLWCRVKYKRFNPGWRLGRLTFGAGFENKEAEVVRVYPRGVNLPDKTPPEQVVEKVLAMGYQRLDREVLQEMTVCQIRSGRGYVVAPLVSGVCDFLMSKGGVLQPLDHALYPTTVENAGYSVIVRRA